MAPPFSLSCELEIPSTSFLSLAPPPSNIQLIARAYFFYLPVHPFSKACWAPLWGRSGSRSWGFSRGWTWSQTPAAHSLGSHLPQWPLSHLNAPSPEVAWPAPREYPNWVPFLYSDPPQHSSQNRGSQMAGHCLLSCLKASWAPHCPPRPLFFSLVQCSSVVWPPPSAAAFSPAPLGLPLHFTISPRCPCPLSLPRPPFPASSCAHTHASFKMR